MYAITLSSIIYLSAFIYPDYLYAGVFVFMTPLIVHESYHGFRAGFAWGLLFFAGHVAWLRCAVPMFAYLAAVAYFSLYSGFWLWFKKLLDFRYVSKIKNHNGKCVASCCTWVISTVTFICLTSYCSMAIFGCLEGYPFINPLLPLVSWSWYLGPIKYIGVINYWIIVICINLSIARLYIKFDIKILIFLIMLLSFPIMFSPFPKKINVKKNDFFYVQPTWHNQKLTAAQMFYRIGRELDLVAIDWPDITFIVLPESAFPYNLLDWQNKLDVWTSLFDNVTIFIGAHRYENGKKYNSLYQLSEGKIIAWYDKQHLMPFVERIVPWLPSGFANILTTQDKVFSYPDHDQSNIIIAGFKPMICSELFCEQKTIINEVKSI